tara:strand:- start:5118 stop:5378 length:261 start_codon:yes stop_codon:yes gene_type:complete
MPDRFTKEKIVSGLFMTSRTLKTTIYRKNRQLFQVNNFETGATQIIHTNRCVVKLAGILYYFLKTIFDYSELAECNKLAVPNAHSR